MKIRDPLKASQGEIWPMELWRYLKIPKKRLVYIPIRLEFRLESQKSK